MNGSGSPFHRAQASAGAAAWTPWAPLTGRFTSVAAARNADGRVELFGVTSAGSAVLWRVQTAVKPETRAKRIAQLVEMLARGEVVHIFKPKPKA